MISAVDSSVILDVLVDNPAHGGASLGMLRKASAEGQLIVCECVLAEIRPAFESAESLSEFLADWQLDFVPSSKESAIKAGENFSRHLERGGKGGRVVPDFLIAAHAVLHAERLIARDRGYLRDYFRDLVVLDPDVTEDFERD